MKKKSFMCGLLVFSILVIIGIVIIENNKISPLNRYETHSDYQSEDEVERNSAEPQKILNNTHTVEYEIVSYEIIDDTDIADQTNYSGEFFISGSIPDPNYLVEYTDYQQMRNDYSDVDEYISSNGNDGMTADEYQAFLDQHLAEYTSSKHPQTKYIFIHLIITNVADGPVDEYINNLRVIAVRGNDVVGEGEFNCYFDSSQHTDGEDRIHSYFVYTFRDNGESIECTIGCELREDYVDFSEENTYYIGFRPVGLDSWNQFDPSSDDGFVALDFLPPEL